MKKAMIIVESRAKTQSISKIVGDNYIVQYCLGHVYDLPDNDLGVDVNKDFTPKYVPVKGKKKLIDALKKDAESVEEIILATDPDREGESIAWHLARLFAGKKIHRMRFNEITEKAIREALNNLTEIDERLVNAQQARRVLDRLVGYKISPLLWRRVKEGLSAGRVQSVALRIICDREREREAFNPEEYWEIAASFARTEKPTDRFEAMLKKIAGEEVKIVNEQQAEEIRLKLESLSYKVGKITTRIKQNNPFPPYITSTLQQDASARLGFSPGRTMTIAQQLYEGLEIGSEGAVGLITYMRTDSVRVSDEAIRDARSFIVEKYGEQYLPATAPRYKKKGGSQDAHEAIRPSSVTRDPARVAKHISADQLKLYTIVWNRFVSSQMNPEKREDISIDVTGGDALFRASGSKQLFDGFRLVYKPKTDTDDNGGPAEEKTNILPPLKDNEPLAMDNLDKSQHFTKPPAAFTEASLIRTLEEKGIGRPSTYVPTIDTIKKRGYVRMDKRAFKPTQWGFIVTDLLTENFKDIMGYDFTARMENDLDSIEEGMQNWVDVVKNFYETFAAELQQASKTMRYEKKVDAVCEKCGAQMVLRSGKFGLFYACSGYPECRNTKPFTGMETTQDLNAGLKQAEPKETDLKCEKCDSPLILRDGRYGKFLACSAYPKCRYSRPFIGDFPCPKKDCEGRLTKRSTKKRRIFYGCTRYPDCDFVSWYAPNDTKCPSCGSFSFKKKTKEKYVLECSNVECAKVFEEETPTPAAE